MTIDVSTIVKSVNMIKTETVELEFDSFESKMGTFTILKKSPVTLEISNQESKRLLISGTVDIEVAIPCDRCLEDVPTNIHFNIDKTLTIGESIVDEEMEETD